MKKEQIYHILYDMALVMSGETHYQTLIQKMIQKLLFHSGFPCGVFLLHSPDDPEDNRCLLESAIGNKDLKKAIGGAIAINRPSNPETIQQLHDPLQDDRFRELYSSAYWLPLPGNRAILLLGSHFPEYEVSPEHVFAPILSNLGKMIDLCIANERYTEQLKLEKEFAIQDMARFRKALDVADDAIMLFDSVSLQCIDSNLATVRMLGYSLIELKKQHISDVCVLNEREETEDIISRIMHGQSQIDVEGELRRKDGTTYPVEVKLSVLSEQGYSPSILAIARDISERKRTEAMLDKYQNHLEEQVAIRTNELQLARDEALAANKEKSNFLANMSHELRTPLNSVIGFASLLKKGMGGDVNDLQRRHLAIIHDNGKHLLNLINGILDLSKVEAGKMDVYLSDIDMHSFIDTIIEAMIVLAKDKGLDMDVVCKGSRDQPMLLRADADKLKQIIFNLVSNAVKFTESGGVKILYGPYNDHSFNITVSDTGIGIEKDAQEKIFNAFHQVEHGFSRKYQGAGLGLSISSKFVELMGGTIRVESEFGKGSHFTISLPNEQKSQ